MAGRGTGVPIWFKCWACRRAYARLYDDASRYAFAGRGGPGRVRLTGRTRPNVSGNRPPRASAKHREYECLDCGHVGWSNHVDLEDLE